MPGVFLIKWAVNDREYRLGIQPGQAATVHEILVFPEKESTFNNLDRVRVKTMGKISEEGFAYLVELAGTEDLDDLLRLIQE